MALDALTSRHLFLPALLALVLIVTAGCHQTNDAGDDANSTDRDVIEATERLQSNAGGQLVLRTIDAHGGLAAWYGAATSSYTWEYANPGLDLHFKSFLVADNRSRQVYHDLLTLGSYQQPEPVSGRFAWNGADAWISPDTLSARINPRFWATTGYYFEQIPFVLADPGLTYEILPDAPLDDRIYHRVLVGYESGIGDSPGDTYTLFIDPETARLFAIVYTVTYGRPVTPGETPRQTLFYYEEFVTVDGLTIPKRFRGFSFVDGAPTEFRNEAWADSISFQRSFDASRLATPAGAFVAPAPG